MRNFVKFPEMYRALVETPRKLTVVLENRPHKYMFGVQNYGEILNHYNPADRDMWDVIVVGYSDKIPTGVPFRVTKLLGVYMLPNGNHKLIVDIERGLFRVRDDIKREVERYKKNYENFTKLRGSLIFFNKY